MVCQLLARLLEELVEHERHNEQRTLGVEAVACDGRQPDQPGAYHGHPYLHCGGYDVNRGLLLFPSAAHRKDRFSEYLVQHQGYRAVEG